MMSLNRYRLMHLAESGHRAAKLALKLLSETDRLLGTILLGNNLVNNAAAAVAAVIALRLGGEFAIAIATGIITLIILVFAEIPPKTVAALHPEAIAFRVVYPLLVIQKIAHPLVVLVNTMGGFLPKLFGFKLTHRDDALRPEELHTLVRQSKQLIPESHSEMLLRILELEKIKVEDVMVARSNIEAINLDDDWDDILEELATSHHTRLPIYRGTLDNIIGEVHIRDVLHQWQEEELTRDDFLEIIQEPLFIPQGTRLTEQLLLLKEKRRQNALVVDEFGDIRGLVTLDEVLEEIVGEFTRNVPGVDEDVHIEEDGSYLIDSQVNIRDLNRKMGWQLPTDGPKTLNGLILELLEDVPTAGTTLKISNLTFETVKTHGASTDIIRVRKLSEPCISSD